MIAVARPRRTKIGERHRCSRCGSRDVGRILRGYPIFSDDLRAHLDAGEVVLGGCIVMGNDPEFRCHACGHEFRDRPVAVR